MQPYVAAGTKAPEFTLRAVFLGMILGLIFGVGNAYLALRVGQTVSASIPAAVLSMAILRIFFKKVSILENNLVQTIASVGEGLAAGVVFTIPALFMLGDHPSPMRIFFLSGLGGILGILFMIPMRRHIIVEMHKELPFPEGTACAEILKSGEAGRSKAILAVLGILLGALHKVCSSAIYLWNEVTTWIFPKLQKVEVSIDCTPSLLGVGFIIGPRISSIIFAGGAFGWWILIPFIRFFAGPTGVIYPGTIPIAQMAADDIWANYIRYIGTGAVAIGGILSLVKIVPIVLKTLHSGFSELFQFRQNRAGIIRTDRDISMRTLIIGSLIIILALWFLPELNLLTILLLVILGFFFVGVTSLTVGIVGSSSNPVSGMTIATILITTLVFLSLGWTERFYLIASLTMGCVVCVAICLAGTTSQDLKTGHLLGATPKWQQIGEMIGILFPALAIGGTLYLLNSAYGIGSTNMPAPQATMMALLAKGVLSGNIPTTLLIFGVMVGLLLEMLRLPVLPFAIGLYLPLSLSTPIIIGGLVALFIAKRSSNNGEVKERGILTASGFVAGDACMGVVIALFTVLGWVNPSGKGIFPDTVAFLIFILLALGLGWISLKKPLRK